MSHLTWLLDQTLWDTVLDANGNIAIASEPYAVSQDIASQVRAVRGECWYDTTQGMPWWRDVLGGYPPASLVESYLEQQALLVPDVETVDATVVFDNATRALIPQLTGTDAFGNTFIVT